MSELEQKIATALEHRLANGRHLHHRDCIHNLPPEQQIDLRRRHWTREQHIDPPNLLGTRPSVSEGSTP